MKKSKTFIGVVLSLLLILSGCAGGNGEGTTAPKSAGNYSYELTAEEKVAEYDALWDFLENDLGTYMDYADERGIDTSSIKDQYRDMVENTASFEEYFETLDEMLGEFDGVADLSLVDAEEFFSNKAMYDYIGEESIGNDWTEVEKAPFNNDLSVKRYTDLGEEGVESKTYQASTEQNIDLKEFDDNKNLFVDYPSFSSEFRDINNDQLNSRLSNDPYEKVIIDISGNPGEDSMLWNDLVSRLISEPLEYTTYQTFQGEKAVEFINENIDSLDGGEIIQSDDDKVVVEITKTIEPNTEVTNNPENIYLVQGDNSGAASEFVNFAKNTGWATTIGEDIAGSGQGIRHHYIMENSGLLVSCNISVQSDAEGNITDLTIAPDMEMEIDEEENLYRRYNTINSGGYLSN